MTQSNVDEWWEIDFRGTDKSRIAVLAEAVEELGLATDAFDTNPDSRLPLSLDWTLARTLTTVLEQAVGPDGQQLTPANDSILDDLVSWLGMPDVVRTAPVAENSDQKSLPEGGFHVWVDTSGSFHSELDVGAQRLLVCPCEMPIAESIVRLSKERGLASDAVIIDPRVIFRVGLDWCSTMLVLDAIESSHASQDDVAKLQEIRVRMILWTASPHRIQADCGHKHGLYNIGKMQ
ncbi:hypothetical protein [Arthrobacter sp. HLT1-20]